MSRGEWFLWVIVTGATVALAVIVMLVLWKLPAPVRERAPSWQPPRIECPEGHELWDCVKGAMYREDT